MNQRNRFIALTLATLLIFLAALATPLTAFADDGAPPPDEGQTESSGPDQVSPPVGGTEGGSEDAPSVAEIIEQIPDGTDLVVLDSEGQVVPLAAQEAADIITSGDPIWCPVGVTPDPTDPLCTPGFSDMATLLLYLAFFQPTSDGTIWIEDAYDSSVNDPAATGFTIDGNSYTTWRNYAIVVQGGWDGVTDSTTITGTSEFNVPLKIINWLDDVTVNDVVVFDTAATGLEVSTNGDIDVSGVIADNNTDEGARLNNTAGSGEVNVTDSTFGQLIGPGNGGHGLDVDSNGDITLTGVVADNNDNSGASIDNLDGTGDILVTSSDFSFNGTDGGAGLIARSAGDITVQTVIANINTLSGVQLNNSFGTGDVVVDTGVFNFNGSLSDGLTGSGIWVLSNGDITLDTVTADSNYWDGAFVNNSDGSGFVLVDNAQFNLNGVSGGGGLQAIGSGNVTLQTVTVNGNYYGGALLYGGTTSGDLLVDTAMFNGNGFADGIGYGLGALFSGNIVLQTVQANGNFHDGAYLGNTDGTGYIFVETAQFNGNGTSGTSGSGLNAFSYGSIGLEDADANGNFYAGAILYNVGGTGGISVYTDSLGTSNFNGNGQWGLSAESDHDISLTDVYANGNVLSDGAYLDNSTGTGNISVYSDNSPITLFSGNGETGLYVISNGHISLTDVLANGNGSYGAHLDNDSGSGNVSVYSDNNVSTDFNGNGGDGLFALSNGAISLTDVQANGNISGSGAHLDNSGGSGNISVYADNSSTTNFNSNGADGVRALSHGQISLTDVLANANGSEGAHLDNSGGSGNVDVYADNSAFTMFSGNGSNGLSALSAGDISLTDLLNNSNSSDGARLDNRAGAGNIFVSADNLATTDFNANGALGLEIYSNGDVSLTDVNANGNAAGGAFVNGSSGPGAIVIDPSMFNGNGGDGLEVLSQGAITLTDVQANGNGGRGAYLDSSFGPGDVSVDPSLFNGNLTYGLQILAGGVITVTDVGANGNGTSGALLATTRGFDGVLVDQGTFDANSDYGLQIFSRGHADLTDIEADGNGSDGARIELLRCGGVSVDNSEFAGNGGYGLVVVSDQAPSLGTITYGGNGAGDTLFVSSKCHKKGPPALPPLPLHVVLVAGGEGVGLDCVQFRGTIVVLPNGDRVSLPCPLGDQVSLGRVDANDLPQILGHQYVFISSMDALVTREGQSVSALDHAMTVDFVIPPADGTSALVILHWNGTEWEELGGYITPDNYFETNANVTGLFVLVKRQ